MLTAAQLQTLKSANPDEYRARLREIEARALGASLADSASPDAGAPHAFTPPHRRSFENLIEAFRRYGVVDETGARGLRDIRRGTIYACAQMRAGLLSSLPLRLYRMEDRAGAGRKVDHRNPLTRLGWPARVRGQRLAEAGSVVEVTDHPLARVLDRPNDDWSGRQLLTMTELGLCTVGQAHWQLEMPSVSGISWLKHSRLEVKRPREGEPFRTVAGWKLDGGALKQGGRDLEPSEVVWMRYIDPEDPDYGVLAPAEVASLGATAYYEALKSNRDLFKQGLRAAGAFVPPEEMTAFDFEQADELTRDVGALLSGSRNNHSTPVFPYRMNFERFDVSPRDAEFVALMDFAVEDTARAFGLPIEMVGGSRRTYANLDAALRAVWMHTMEPEACFIAEELTAKLLPQAGLDGHFLAFDLSDVVALQDDEGAAWGRAKEQIDAGALRVNEWREAEGLEPLPEASELRVGDVNAAIQVTQLMGQSMILPEQAEALLVNVVGLSPDQAAAIIGAGPIAIDQELGPVDDGGAPITASWVAHTLRTTGESDDAPVEAGPGRLIEYGSDEHRAIMRTLDEAEAPEIDAFAEAVSELMRRQAESLSDALTDPKRANMRLSIGDIGKLFNRARWIREFRERGMRDLRSAVRVGKDLAEGAVGDTSPYDPEEPAALRELRGQTQRFAEEVNDTTWRLLRGSLIVGLRDGETPRDLARRVQSVMGARIRSSAETIARTEVHQAVQRGQLRAVGEMDGDFTKRWVSSLDSRVRDTHRDAHNTTIPLDEDFRVGGATGAGPGNMSTAEESINCRCTLAMRRVRRIAEKDEGRDVSAPAPPATPSKEARHADVTTGARP